MRIHNNYSGFALLVFIVVLLGVAGVVGSNFIKGKTKTVYTEKIEHDQAVLRKAKEALLSYAVEYHKPPNSMLDMARLPCPDTTSAGTEGDQDGNCGVRHANNSGYLPWKALGTEPLRDSSGECLWYVVSGDYKDTPYAGMLNEDSYGLLRIQDENSNFYHVDLPEDRPIALVIAPGPILDGQSRTPDPAMTQCRGNYTESNYLEGGTIDYAATHLNNADQIWTYLYASATNNLENNAYNDRMIWITQSEYWSEVKAQNDIDAADMDALTQALASCLVGYSNEGANDHHWLPWPSPVDMGDYRLDASYSDQNDPSPSLMGRFPYDFDDSNSKELAETSVPAIAYNDLSDIVAATNCLTADQLSLWTNWKDHFFYVVSSDFQIDGETEPDLTLRCGSVGDCVTINEMVSADKVAGVVFYADRPTSGQLRTVFPDTEEKNKLSSYLETDTGDATISNAHQYPVDAAFSGVGGDVNEYFRSIGDLAYCVVVNSSADLTVSNCN